MDFEDIRRQHKNIRRKIARCNESGDLRRLLGLRDQLERVRQDIAKMEPDDGLREEAREERAVFRKSYGYEFFMESLLYRVMTKAPGFVYII